MDIPATKPETKNRLRRTRLFIWLFLGLLVVTFLIWRINLSFVLNARLKSLQEGGHPVTLAELQQLRYAPIPDESNAARFFNRAIAQCHYTNAISRKLFEEIWSQDKVLSNSQLFSAEYQVKATQLLNENREMLELLHQSPPGNQSRFALDFGLGYNLPLPHLAPLAFAAQALSLQAICHAEQNQMAAAMEDLHAAFRILDSLADEPILISHLVRMKCRRTIIGSLERILSRHSFTEAQLLELSDAFHKRQYPNSMARSLEGELCFCLYAFHNPPQQAATSQSVNDESVEAERKDKLRWQKVFNWMGFTTRDINFFIDIMSKRIAATEIPFPERLKFESHLNRRVEKASLGISYFYSPSVLGVLGPVYLNEADDVARSQIIQTALAIERYRLTHQNQLPEKQEDLDALLRSAPEDPYTGKNLQYKKLSSGYLLYSVGRNKKDDGGTEKTSKKLEGPDDIAFTVER